MVIWGMGIPLGLAGWLGWIAALWALVRYRRSEHLIPVLWVGLLFLHQGTQWVKSMRYFLPIYPLLALLAAWWIHRIWDFLIQRERSRAHLVRSPYKLTVAILLFSIPFATFLWAIAFMSIYTTPHSRIQATEWIFANVPPKSVLANEHWDDALPLRMKKDGKDLTFDAERLTLEWYSDDSLTKLRQCLEKLDRSEYIILSSNRLYDSIPRLPMRFPMSIAYYEALFSGELGFERVAEFTSYPRIFGIEFPDQSAEEAFSVYDHPRVQIFKKTQRYSPQATAQILGNVNWDAVRRLSARQATELTEEEWRKMERDLDSTQKVRFTSSPIRPFHKKEENEKKE
jgi:hypothetical protein